MQPRTEALIGGGVLVALVSIAALLGSRKGPGEEDDRRPSVYLTGPYGARGLSDALGRMGVEVHRFRRGLRKLETDSGAAMPAAFVLLDPTEPVTGGDVDKVRAWNDARPEHGLVLAGRGAAAVMRCYGYVLDWRSFDSLDLRSPAGAVGRWPRVSGVLAASSESVVTDSSRVADAEVTGCAVPMIERAETLLTATTGRVVALRLIRADSGGEVVLLADAALARNRAVRETAAGPFMLGLFAGRFQRVTFEEGHHGFGEGGSLAAATLAWSRHSPLGWGMWQLAVVGVLALLAGAVRFGPPRRVLPRKRRSPLEHVRALATALAAAHGHDVAIGAIVEGLRRRLLPPGQRGRGDWHAWLAHLAEHVESPRARDAARTLTTLTRPGQLPEGVLRAANAVEDVWEELRP
jgi:hypothetical protein